MDLHEGFLNVNMLSYLLQQFQFLGHSGPHSKCSIATYDLVAIILYAIILYYTVLYCITTHFITAAISVEKHCSRYKSFVGYVNCRQSFLCVFVSQDILFYLWGKCVLKYFLSFKVSIFYTYSSFICLTSVCIDSYF